MIRTLTKGMFAVVCGLAVTHSFACTHLKVTAKDNSVIIGRSMEFGPDLETDIYTVNRDTSFKSTTPDGKDGLHWRSKYGYLALSGFHLFSVSGINEKGLSFDLLYFPGFAEYEPYDKNDAAKTMPYYQMGDYLLGNYENVDEIKSNLARLDIYAKALEHAGQPVIFPVHFVVTDSSGKGVVIELFNKKCHVFDDKTGILTNSPSYPWQITNLANYINLSPHAASPIVKDGITYNATGQGSGAIGLPGDYTPPSRFVKMAFLTSSAIKVDTADKAVNLTQHILNNVDIPLGAVRGSKGNDSSTEMDKTQWIVIKDLKHKVIYFRSYYDLTLQKIDMSMLDLSPKSPKHSIPIAGDKANIIDATTRFLKS